MKSIAKDEKAFHPAIIGIIIIAVIGITIGILLMSYSSISQNVRPATFKTATNENFSLVTTTPESSWQALAHTVGASATDPTLPYSLTLKNSTQTFVRGTDYNVTVANSSLQVRDPLNGTILNVTYDYEGAGTASLDQIDSNTYKGFDLTSIAPIVLAAGLIITIVIGFAGMVMGGGRE